MVRGPSFANCCNECSFTDTEVVLEHVSIPPEHEHAISEAEAATVEMFANDHEFQADPDSFLNQKHSGNILTHTFIAAAHCDKTIEDGKCPFFTMVLDETGRKVPKFSLQLLQGGLND